MKKYKKLHVFILLFLGSMLTFKASLAENNQNFAPNDNNSATQIIIFKPNNSQGKLNLGRCFSSSLASTRPDAWRCQINNSIYDPCFATSINARLICDADPTTNKTGFPIQLVNTLPRTTNTATALEKPWIVALADGSICTAYTGTMPIIANQGNMVGLRYGCLDINNATGQYSGIVDGSIDTSKKIWQASKMIYTVEANSSPPQALKVIEIAVKTAWQ